ncbi:MAG: HAD-IIIC family phosphatase [Candidatus Binatia bacterium]
MASDKGPRELIDEMFQRGHGAEASAMLAELWRQQPVMGNAAYIVSRYEQMNAELPMTPYRLALLRSFTVEPLVPLLRAGAFATGVNLTLHVGDFNAYAQEILNPQSNLYQFNPDAVVLAIQTRDLLPDLWCRFTELSREDVERIVDRAQRDLSDWVKTFRCYSKAHLIIHSLEMPGHPSAGILDAQGELSQIEALRRVNEAMRSVAREYAGVYILDYDALIALHGRLRWHDEGKWLTVRLPIAADGLVHLANEWLRFLHPVTGKVCKALVTDLDNTLWGGIIGEDGMSGIQVGPEHPGAAYQSLQHAMLDLYQRGIILAVCSKNNSSDAMEAIEKHPGMLLRPHHFAALRINWNDKAQNLREIASELNIGIDALAFLDDNPVEREWVRSQLPVTVIDLPQNPMDYAGALRESPIFERLSLSDEDRERGRYYAEERQRTELKCDTASLEDFYRSLEMVVEIAYVTPQTLTRVAQLTQKTNQFNLTTRRYTEQQIAEMTASTDWRVYTLRASDRFGDNGLVGVAIARYDRDFCEIDSFLMSCRVVGRTVETAFLSRLAEEALHRGTRYLRGWYLPTKKNELVKDFYEAHGFKVIEESEKGSLWEFELNHGCIRAPEWVTCHVLEEEMDR